MILCLKHRLSGLIVDVFGEVAVIASSAAWVEKYRQQIESLVSQVAGIRHTWWRSSVDILKEEGLQVEQSHSPLAQKFKVKKLILVLFIIFTCLFSFEFFIFNPNKTSVRP